MDSFNTLGEHFRAAGDYNAKHTHWGSRLMTPRGRNRVDCVSPASPTYWSTDEFAVTKNIPRKLISASSLSGLQEFHRTLQCLNSTSESDYQLARMMQSLENSKIRNLRQNYMLALLRGKTRKKLFINHTSLERDTSTRGSIALCRRSL